MTGRAALVIDVGYLAEALARVVAERPRVRLLIVGDGPARPELEAKLGASASFVGYRTGEDLADHYAAADIFAFCSVTETFGNVVLEALASGAVAVVTDSGGPSEYVKDGVNGFVVPVGDIGALTMHLETLLSDPALRDRLAAAARQGVENRHPYPRMIGDIRAVYDGVLGPLRPAARGFASASQGVAAS